MVRKITVGDIYKHKHSKYKYIVVTLEDNITTLISETGTVHDFFSLSELSERFTYIGRSKIQFSSLFEEIK